MCGISGIFAHQLTDEHIQLVEKIIETQTARGPDHHAMTVCKAVNSQAILGHNRLSIIDLSEQANQPMQDNTGRYHLVFNGEIYNYIELRAELLHAGFVFTSSSDTEVILHAFAHWGIECLNRFHGPFAFALFDQQTEILWLCRDRLAIRPLYYTQVKNVLYFASSTTALAKRLRLQPNLSYLAKGLKYLVYEDDSDSTAYLNLFSLPAGCYLKATVTKHATVQCAVNRYYNLAQNIQTLIDNPLSGNMDDMLNAIQAKLDNAVKIRLRTDVPLGISLSGGLDSSSVAALVSKQHHDTIGFSFSHPQHKKSEGPLVAKCADYLNIKMQYVWPTPTEIIDALHKTIIAQDAPFSTFSIVAQYMLYQHVRAAGVKVLLGGQGGDEAFMGYKKFLLFQLQQGIKHKRYFSTAKKILQTMPMLLAEMTSFSTYWRHRHRYLPGSNIQYSALQLPDSPTLYLGGANQELWKRQLYDITQFSLPTLLRYEDKNAMGNSVESRLPYMDHQLIELGLALPESIKLRAGYGKWAIRKIMQDKIPDQIRLARYKRGFDISLAPLLKSGLGKSIRSTLHENRQAVSPFLKNSKNIDNDFSDQQLVHRKNAMAEAITLLWLNKTLND